MSRKGGRLLDAFHGFGYQLIDNRVQIAGPFKGFQLAISAGAAFKNLVNIFKLLAASEIVNHIVNEGEQFENQITHRHFDLLAEVDELAIQTPPNGSPFVLL